MSIAVLRCMGLVSQLFVAVVLLESRCVEALHIPNNSFCPQDLPALGRLSNYYMSIYLEHIVSFLDSKRILPP